MESRLHLGRDAARAAPVPRLIYAAPAATDPGDHPASVCRGYALGDAESHRRQLGEGKQEPEEAWAEWVLWVEGQGPTKGFERGSTGQGDHDSQAVIQRSQLGQDRAPALLRDVGSRGEECCYARSWSAQSRGLSTEGRGRGGEGKG